MPSSNAGRRSAGWVVGLAAGAVLLGHGITYAIVHPDAHDRAGFLAATGHAYLHLLDGPGIVLAVVSALAAALIGFGRLGAAPDRGALFRGLAAVQLGAFVGMELVERLASATGLHLPSDAVLLLIGICVQLALARLGAWLLTSLHRGAERLAGELARGRVAFPRASLRVDPLPALVPVTSSAAGPRAARGPPSRRR